MNSLQRLLSNTALAFVSVLILKASNTFLFVLVGRMLGPSDGGVFNLGVTYFTIVFGLSAFGLHEILVRDLAARREETPLFLVNYVLLRGGLTLGTYLLFAGFLWWWGLYTVENTAVILIMALAALPEALFGMGQAIFEAHERLAPPSVAALVQSAVKLGMGAYLLLSGGGVAALAWVLPLGSLVGLLVMLWPLWQLTRPWLNQTAARANRAFSWRVMRETPNFWVIHFFSVLDYQTDVFLLSVLLTETHVGWYGAAQTVLLVFWMIPTAVRAALYPLMARYYHNNQASLTVLYEESTRLLLTAILPMAAGVALLAEPIILLIFDDSFLPAVPALQWSIWAAVFAVINVPSARLLIIAHHQRAATWITGVSMGANIVANLWLIPLWGVVGAAMSRTIASLVFTAVIYVFAQRKILRHSLWSLVPRPLLATAVMAAVVFLVRDINWVLTIPLGTAVYLVAIILLGGLTRRDRDYVRQLWG